MAELIYPNVAGNYQQGLGYGRQLRAQDMAQQNQSRLSELAARAYGASPDERGSLIQQAIGVDPQAGFALNEQLSGQDKARSSELLRKARLLESAPEQYKASLYKQIYPTIAQELPGVPTEYTPEVAEGIRAYIAAHSGAPDLGDRYRVVGGTLVDLQNPTQAVYTAPQRYLTDSGLIEIGPEGPRELTLGGPSGQPMGVSIDPNLPPEVQADIRARPGMYNEGGPADVEVPAQTAIAAQMPQGGRILPRGAGDQAERLQLARDAAARSAEVSRLAVEAADQRRRFGTIPAGFRVNAAGTALEAVPGGPKPAGSAATEGERKAATLLKRLEGSLSQLETAVRENPAAASPSMAAEIGRGLPLIGDVAANALNSQERQRVEAAQLDILDAALTLGTGAAYTREQLQGYRRSFFPQIGDSDATIRDKSARLDNVIEAARIAAGRAAPAASAQPATQTRPALPPGFSWED